MLNKYIFVILKGTSYVAEYPSHGGQAYAQKGFPTYEVHSSGQEGGHEILSQNVKYIPSQEYQKQQYANHDVASYGKSAQQYQPSGKVKTISDCDIALDT